MNFERRWANSYAVGKIRERQRGSTLSGGTKGYPHSGVNDNFILFSKLTAPLAVQAVSKASWN